MFYIFFLFRIIFGRELAVIYNNYKEERKNSAAWLGESCVATLFHARTLNIKNKIGKVSFKAVIQEYSLWSLFSDFAISLTTFFPKPLLRSVVL